MNSLVGPTGKFRFYGKGSILTWRTTASVHSRNVIEDHAVCSVLDTQERETLDELPALSRLISNKIKYINLGMTQSLNVAPAWVPHLRWTITF